MGDMSGYKMTEIESMDTGALGSASLEMPDTWQYEGAVIDTVHYLTRIGTTVLDELCTTNKFNLKPLSTI